MLGLSGQLVRVMADAQSNDAGDLPIEFTPRARAAWSAGAAVVWYQPTFNAILKTPDVPSTVWQPGFTEGVTVEFVEAL
jgi:hypothetical protein